MEKVLKMGIFTILFLCRFSSPVFASGEQEWNGHYYGYIDASGISWMQAASQAAGLEFSGLTGHLLTVTSQAENDAIESFLGEWPSLAARWIGAYQLPDQGAPDVGWQWVTGEPWAYTNWHSDNNPANFVGPEPNDAQTETGIENNEENVAFYSTVLGNSSKPWYDAPGDISYSDGYLVEYSPLVTPEPVSSSLFLLGVGTFALKRFRKNRPNAIRG